MNVVFIRSNPVNPDSRVEKEINSLIKNGTSAQIIGWDREYNYKEEISNISVENGDVKITRFGIKAKYGSGMKNLIPLIKFQYKLYKWLVSNIQHYDIIHACDFDIAIIASIIKVFYKKKVVYDIFDFFIDSFNIPIILKGLIKKLDYSIINYVDSVIICSEKRKEQIVGSHPKKLVIIHNTPSNTNIKQSYEEFNKTKDNVVKIVYVGILSDGRLIKELADIIIDKPYCELHIGGFGYLGDYLQEISTKSQNIKFYGKISYNKTLELENSCDIITAIYDPNIPNHYYAAPNKFYEALMLGKPLIMVKNTGMDNIVSENEFGEVIEYNKESLEHAIENLILKKQKWSEISYKMKKLYEEQYSWTEMEERLMDMYNCL